MQRDRNFSDYQDLELAYELRPGYWIEPHEGWGEGKVELLELPTADETNDNIVAAWAPNGGLDAGKPLAYGYRITSLEMDQSLTPGGRTVGTFRVAPRALGAPESPPPGATRFLIDFSGGDLSYYMSDPSLVQTIATASAGRVLRTFLTPNTHIRGFRAGVDIAVDPGQSADLGFPARRPRALRRRRYRGRPWPERGPPRLPARRRQGADRDLDLSLAGVRAGCAVLRATQSFQSLECLFPPFRPLCGGAGRPRRENPPNYNHNGDFLASTNLWFLLHYRE